MPRLCQGLYCSVCRQLCESQHDQLSLVLNLRILLLSPLSHFTTHSFCIFVQVVTFIDLAGHERYLKTTIFGMTGHSPDYCMLMIGANAGIIGMTKG